MMPYSVPKPFESLPKNFSCLPAAIMAMTSVTPAVIPPTVTRIGMFHSSTSPAMASPAPREKTAQTTPSRMPSKTSPLLQHCTALQT